MVVMMMMAIIIIMNNSEVDNDNHGNINAITNDNGDSDNNIT